MIIKRMSIIMKPIAAAVILLWHNKMNNVLIKVVNNNHNLSKANNKRM